MTVDDCSRPASARLVVIAGLYLLALVIRLVAAAQIPFPATEPSAYYASVAANLVRGEGLVSHAVWSYATPPLVVPKPAFELWLPMSTFVSAAAMAILGVTWWAAQVGGALLGALLAPLAWARGASERPVSRRWTAGGRGAVAIAAGVLAATPGPLVLGAAVPDSYTPFTVFTVAAALLVPRVLGTSDVTGAPMTARRPSVAGGSRPGPGARARLPVAPGGHLAGPDGRCSCWPGRCARSRRARGCGTAFARLWPIVVGGLLVVTPWLVRNVDAFGSAFPGQAVENMFLVRNEDIFAFLDRPDRGPLPGAGPGDGPREPAAGQPGTASSTSSSCRPSRSAWSASSRSSACGAPRPCASRAWPWPCCSAAASPS